uniref:Uncharacterized protein n=1 Tax=Nelumbo nucifera TaxID=4432 RepID=A0A822ZRC2_NELNU|nr:TPA_asm: hypothetical protein HUJ06_004206 [Nelumbo nucifera]
MLSWSGPVLVQPHKNGSDFRVQNTQSAAKILQTTTSDINKLREARKYECYILNVPPQLYRLKLIQQA